MIDASKRKEAIAAWKNRRPNMGVFVLRCVPTGDAFIGSSSDTDRAMNGIRARLDAGAYRNRKLQALWDEHGPDSFSYEVAELLEYDDPGDDHAGDLAALLSLVAEKMPDAELM